MKKEGFSTTLKYFELPRDGLIQLRFPNDSDHCLFNYTSTSSTELGVSMGIPLDSPVFDMIKEEEKKWTFIEVRHIKPTTNNPRDFYWTIFQVYMHYPKLVKILEYLHRDKDEEPQSSTGSAKE